MITNKTARLKIEKLQDFKASNLFSYTLKKPTNSIYIVYSYGTHFPMFIFKKGEWYENSDKYSRTTSKQQNQCRPSGVKITLKNTEEMQNLIS